jgi:glycosyltransferase involved in cell wall biosynthesis
MRLMVVSWLPLDPVDSGYKSRVMGLYTPMTRLCDLLLVSPAPGPCGLQWKGVGKEEDKEKENQAPDSDLTDTNPPVTPARYAGRTFSRQFREGVFKRAWEFQPDFLIAEGVWAGPASRKAAASLKIPWGIAVTPIEILAPRRIYPPPVPQLLWAYERTVYRHADRLFVSSVEQAVRLQKGLRPHPPRISVVPNGARVARMASEEEVQDQRSAWHIHPEERIGLFIGRMDYLPNQRGLEWFSKKVLSHIGEMPFRIRWLAVGVPQPVTPIPPFEFVGYAEDLDLALAAADVCIAPNQQGSGTSSKVLDYLGAGCPVIATPQAVSGLPLEGDRDALITQDPEEFARFVRMVLLDPALAEDLGSHGCSLITQELNWDLIAEKMFREISRSWGLAGAPVNEGVGEE